MMKYEELQFQVCTIEKEYKSYHKSVVIYL